MWKVISSILAVAIVAIGVFYWNKKECIEACINVAPAKPSDKIVGKYIGREEPRLFKTKCKSEDVSNNNPFGCVTKMYPGSDDLSAHRPQKDPVIRTTYEYVIVRKENLSFYVDFSNPQNWSLDVDETAKKATLNAPKIEVMTSVGNNIIKIDFVKYAALEGHE